MFRSLTAVLIGFIAIGCGSFAYYDGDIADTLAWAMVLFYQTPLSRRKK